MVFWQEADQSSCNRVHAPSFFIGAQEQEHLAKGVLQGPHHKMHTHTHTLIHSHTVPTPHPHQHPHKHLCCALNHDLLKDHFSSSHGLSRIPMNAPRFQFFRPLPFVILSFVFAACDQCLLHVCNFWAHLRDPAWHTPAAIVYFLSICDGQGATTTRVGRWRSR